jgi:hypothetical protein
MYWSIMFLTALASIAIYFGSMSVPPQAFYAYDTCNLTKVKSLSISSITDPASWNSMINTVTGTAKIAAAQSECVGNYSVYRLSFSLFAFFGTICLASLCTSAVHAGLWCVKIVAFFVLIVGTFFIPNEFFLGYEHFARVASCLFLVLQIVILIDFVYDLDECTCVYVCVLVAALACFKYARSQPTPHVASKSPSVSPSPHTAVSAAPPRLPHSPYPIPHPLTSLPPLTSFAYNMRDFLSLAHSRLSLIPRAAGEDRPRRGNRGQVVL